MFKDTFVVCSNCKRVRISPYTWIVVPLPDNNLLTHGTCPRCVILLYPEFATRIFQKMRDREAGKFGRPDQEGINNHKGIKDYG